MRQARQVVSRARMRHEAKRALVESHLGVNSHQREPARGQESSTRIECMPGGNRDNWLVRLRNLGLQLVQLFDVVAQALITAFFLHVEHRSEIGSIAPLLPFF